MKLTKTQQDFIKKTVSHPDVCNDWKESIKANFPKLFKKEYPDGWYKGHGRYLGFFIDKKEHYGISYEGRWFNGNSGSNIAHSTKATLEEIETHLIEEAKKRGYASGNYKCLYHNDFQTGCDPLYHRYEDRLWLEHGCCYGGGKWAEIISKEMTHQEIEEELGYKFKLKK